MLRENSGTRRRFIRFIPLFTLAGAAIFPAETPLEPVTVCDVLHHLSADAGKNFAVLGRYSFRESGSWIGEQSCDPAVDPAPQLWLVESSKDAPKPPGNFELDAAVLRKKFAELQRHTSLGKFRFGTPDYDRWAVIYGLVKQRERDEVGRAAADLVYRGSGVIIFLTPQ